MELLNEIKIIKKIKVSYIKKIEKHIVYQKKVTLKEEENKYKNV